MPSDPRRLRNTSYCRVVCSRSSRPAIGVVLVLLRALIEGCSWGCESMRHSKFIYILQISDPYLDYDAIFLESKLIATPILPLLWSSCVKAKYVYLPIVDASAETPAPDGHAAGVRASTRIYLRSVNHGALLGL